MTLRHHDNSLEDKILMWENVEEIHYSDGKSIQDSIVAVCRLWITLIAKCKFSWSSGAHTAKKWPMVTLLWTYNNASTVIYFEKKWVKMRVFSIFVTLLFLNITLYQVSQGLWVGTVWTPEGQENFYFATKVIQNLQTATMVSWMDLQSELWISSKKVCRAALPP